MPRTDEDAVAGIIEIDEEISLTPFIEVANALVTEKCTASDYSDERLELIERWLAAHFYAIRDPRAASESAGVSTSYQRGQLGYNLAFTQWGQMAMTLDTAGSLAALSKATEDGIPRRAGVVWLGKTPEEREQEDE